MTLGRDTDYEQKYGMCSYCGATLLIIETSDGNLIFDSCPYCDEYELVEELEDCEEDTLE